MRFTACMSERLLSSLAFLLGGVKALPRAEISRMERRFIILLGRTEPTRASAEDGPLPRPLQVSDEEREAALETITPGFPGTSPADDDEMFNELG